jgi:V-type H+-transporting ATPase proteolipid subunit
MSLSDPQLWTGLGAALSIFLCSTGSAIASAEAGVYALRKHGYAAFVPIIISGVLAIYGIIISVLLVGKMETSDLTAVDGYRNLSAGLSVGE